MLTFKVNSILKNNTLTHSLIFLFFTIVVISFKWHTLDLPLYWDEIVVYGGPIFDLYNQGLSYLTKPDSNFNHPYGLQLILAGLFTIFGPSITLIRLFCLLMASLTMFCLFKFGTQAKNTYLGLSAALLFFSLPEVFVQSSMVIGDNILAAYGMIFALLLFNKKYIGAIFIGLIMGLTRETSLAYVVLALSFIFLEKRISLKSIIATISPLLSLSFFYFYRFIIGMNNPFKTNVPESHIVFNRPLSEISSLLSNTYDQIFTERGKDFLFYCAISCIFLFLIQFLLKNKIKFIQLPKIKLSIILSVALFYLCFLTFFSFYSETLIRYFFPLIPFTVLISLTLLSHVNKYLPLFTFALIPLQYYPEYKLNECNAPIATGQEYDMEYVSVIETHRRGAHYLLTHYNKEDITICSGWPIIVELEKTYAGYLNAKPLFRLKDGYFEDCDIFIVANNMARNIIEMKEPLIKEGKIKLNKRIEYQCKYYEVYETLHYNKL